MLFLFRYYKQDKDVKDDVELQAFLNEVSLSGTGPNGGIGRVNMKTNDRTCCSSILRISFGIAGWSLV